MAAKNKESHFVLCVKPCVLCDTFFVFIFVCIAKAAKNRNGRKEYRKPKYFLCSTSPGIFLEHKVLKVKFTKCTKENTQNA